MNNIIEAKDILEWCFTVASLIFGVFGFLYSTYATAMFQDPDPPPITLKLKLFCRALALVLIVLTVISVTTSWTIEAGLSVWAIVSCFVVLTGISVYLAYEMN